MARSKIDIGSQFDAEVNNTPGLENLTTSEAGEWRLWRGVVVSVIFFVESLWDAFKAEVLVIVSNNRYGHGDWYRSQALFFQYGDALEESNGKIYYPVIDPEKRIVKRCAVTKSGGKMIIKVAGETAKLTTLQITAFNSYMEDIKPFCVDHQTVSIDPDEMRCEMIVYYDGKLGEEFVKNGVEVAITQYLSNVDFNGKFNINTFRDAVEKVDGVEIGGVDIQVIQIRQTGSVLVNVFYDYVPYSGWYKWLTTEAEDDASVITYIAN